MLPLNALSREGWTKTLSSLPYRRSYVAGEIKTRYADYVNWNGLVDVDADLPAHDIWVIYVGKLGKAKELR